MKKNFPLNTRVSMVGIPDGDRIYNATGTILGTSIVDVIDHYIVLLDDPTPTHRAISITEACLKKLEDFSDVVNLYTTL